MNSKELQENFDDIKDMYLNQNKTPQEIANIYNSKRYQINYLLEKHGIQKTISESRRKYYLNEQYFDEIDTPNKAYILGFLYADGYINLINNTIVLSLSYEDKDILEDIKAEIGCDKPLFENYYTNKEDRVERHMVSLILASKYMCESIQKWGLVPNKTFTIEFPDFLQDELVSHFIRGYFDGDGCACICKDSSKKIPGKRFITSIMSSYKFCIGMQKFLKEKQDINFNVSHPSKKDIRNGLIRSFSNKENIKFMNYIYKDADLFMKRKYNKYKEFFKNS